MARAYKPMKLSSRKRSKAETESRIKLEEQLRGKRDKLKPPTNITKGAKKYFKMIVDLD